MSKKKKSKPRDVLINGRIKLYRHPKKDGKFFYDLEYYNPDLKQYSSTHFSVEADCDRETKIRALVTEAGKLFAFMSQNGSVRDFEPGEG